MTEVQIADHRGLPAAPRLRKIGKPHGDSIHAGQAGIDDAPYCRSERGAEPYRHYGLVSPRKTTSKLDSGGYPDGDRRKEQKVNDAKPRGRQPVEISGKGVPIPEREQGGDDKTDGQQGCAKLCSE